MNIQLTIDINIQKSLERELNNVVDMFNPDMALAIVMDPNTGEILGMASRPDYDPNNYKNYSQEVLNWFSTMNDCDKANFLYHLESYGKDKNEDEIVFDKLKNGEYLPHVMSEKKHNLERLKSYIVGDAIFSVWSGISVANYKEISEIIYNSEPMKQLLLLTNQVLPPAFALTCILMTFYHWYHYSLCNFTIDEYQNALNQSNILKLIKTK